MKMIDYFGHQIKVGDIVLLPNIKKQSFMIGIVLSLPVRYHKPIVAIFREARYKHRSNTVMQPYYVLQKTDPDKYLIYDNAPDKLVKKLDQILTIYNNNETL